MSEPKKPRNSAKDRDAAMSVLQAWLDEDGQNWGDVERAADVVLSHLRKKLAPKVSRKGLYLKGRSFEYEVRDEAVKRGLECRRIPGSGGGPEKGDVHLTTGWGERLVGECKIRAELPAYITTALNDNHHFAAVRQNHGETFVIVSLSRFLGMCQ